MKHFLIVAFSFLASTAFSQNWKEYIIDSNLTLDFPENYTITDTMHQKVIMAQLDYGLVMITSMENKGEYEIAVTDQDDLKDEYKGFRKGMLRSAKGRLIAEGPLERNGVMFWNFSYTAKMGEVKQTRYCQILLLNKHIYTINFWEAADKSQEMAPPRERFFSSVLVPKGMYFENQKNLIDEKTAAYRTGHAIGNLFGKLVFFGALIVVGVIVIRMLRKKKEV